MMDEGASLQREVARLVQERSELFSRSRVIGGPSPADQSRLRAIERQLDECYTVLRRTRASRANARQAREDIARHGAVGRRYR